MKTKAIIQRWDHTKQGLIVFTTQGLWEPSGIYIEDWQDMTKYAIYYCGKMNQGCLDVEATILALARRWRVKKPTTSARKLCAKWIAHQLTEGI